jgi:hypothetical protein
MLGGESLEHAGGVGTALRVARDPERQQGDALRELVVVDCLGRRGGHARRPSRAASKRRA